MPGQGTGADGLRGAIFRVDQHGTGQRAERAGNVELDLGHVRGRDTLGISGVQHLAHGAALVLGGHGKDPALGGNLAQAA